jgi:PadR family transcriptional regulator PadR
MSRKRRVLSQPAATTLRRFLDAPGDELHGFRIIKEAGIPPSTLYPVLRALAEQRQFLVWRWEGIDPTVEKRPPRRLYRLNANAARAAREALAEYEEHQRHGAGVAWPSPVGTEA